METPPASRNLPRPSSFSHQPSIETNNEFSADNRRGQHVDKDMSGEGLQLVLDRIERKRKTKTLVEYMCPGPENEPAERNY